MIGERIKQARKAAGLSQRALAEKVGVSAMAISKFENGQLTPASGTLLTLADAVGVRVEYFFRTARVTLATVEYRKRSRLSKKVLAQIEGDVVEQIERYLELEEYLPRMPIEPFAVPEGLPERIEEYAEIEGAAVAVRDAWKLGRNPVPELTDTLEEHGIKVLLAEALHSDKFDGLASQVDGTPVIVVGKGWSGDRQRFTLTHELGHLLLQGRLAPGLEIERAANRFAGAFLVPESEVRKELGERRTWLEPAELCYLKMAYGLSMNAWLYRAKDLGILSPSRYQAMARYFRSKGWHKQEPCGEYPQEEPKLFHQLVYHALAEELIGESKAAELLRIPLTELRAERTRDGGTPADHL